MRHALPLLLATCLMPLAAFAAEGEGEAISVTIARTMLPATSCNTDLGYAVVVGPKDGKDTAQERSRKQVREQYPEGKNLSHKDNFGKRDKLLGRHLVVLKAVEKKGECTVTMYGAGFGADEAAAKKDAKKYLGKRWPMRADGTELTVERSEKL